MQDNDITFKVLRFYKDTATQKVLKTGLTRDEAVEHCSDDESSSETCSTYENILHARQHGPWFDGFAKE